MTEPDAAESRLSSAVFRALIGAVVVVAVPALVFWVIGSFDRDDDPAIGDLAAEEEDLDTVTDPPADPDPDAGDADVGDTDVEEGDPTPSEPDPPPSVDDGVQEPSADDDGTQGVNGEGEDGDAQPDPEPEPAPEPDPEPEPEPAPEPEGPVDQAFPPGEVTVQVLDGNAGGDGSTARRVAQELRDLGYRVIAENRARPNTTTSVQYTAGYEAQARQVAAEIGGAEIRQQTNLSASVMVHVVIGADRG